jgi:hypothetical protein
VGTRPKHPEGTTSLSEMGIQSVTSQPPVLRHKFLLPASSAEEQVCLCGDMGVSGQVKIRRTRGHQPQAIWREPHYEGIASVGEPLPALLEPARRGCQEGPPQHWTGETAAAASPARVKRLAQQEGRMRS